MKIEIELLNSNYKIENSIMGSSEEIIVLEDYKVSKRPPIKKTDEIRLWVRAGGRCELCNKYLLDVTYDVNIGEMAHIVGWSKAKGSPRGENLLPEEDRNIVDNLMLMCAEHHKIIDSKSLLSEFTVERLIKHKQDHELRIYHQTGLSVDAESVVLRMLGGIRGLPVEVSQIHVRHVLFKNDQRYARFLDSFDKQSIEIDLHSLPDPDEGWDLYWNIGKGIIDKNLKVLMQGLAEGSVRHLSVFALTRIPLLVYLGYRLGDKIPTSVYQKHRCEEETWLWSDTEPVETFVINKLISGNSEKVALILSLSGTIRIDALPSTITKEFTIYEVRPIETSPHRNIFRNKASYHNFVKTYHHFLSKMEQADGVCSEVHLFPAIPISAGIACGRGLMREAHPAMIVYDLNKNGYQPTLIINN